MISVLMGIRDNLFMHRAYTIKNKIHIGLIKSDKFRKISAESSIHFCVYANLIVILSSESSEIYHEIGFDKYMIHISDLMGIRDIISDLYDTHISLDGYSR